MMLHDLDGRFEQKKKNLCKLQNEYQELRRQCQDFATALLDHTRTSNELEVMLNHDPTGPIFEHGERMHLNRLKLAIKLRQKKVYFSLNIFSFISIFVSVHFIFLFSRHNFCILNMTIFPSLNMAQLIYIYYVA